MDDTGMDEEKPSPQIPVSQLKISDEITTKHSYYEISTVNLKIEQKDSSKKLKNSRKNSKLKEKTQNSREKLNFRHF